MDKIKFFFVKVLLQTKIPVQESGDLGDFECVLGIYNFILTQNYQMSG